MKTTVTTTVRTVRSTVITTGGSVTTEIITRTEGVEAEKNALDVVDEMEKTVRAPIDDFFTRLRGMFRDR